MAEAAPIASSPPPRKRSIGHALELRHRLPRLWHQVQSGSGAGVAGQVGRRSHRPHANSSCLTCEAAGGSTTRSPAVAGRVGTAEPDLLGAERIQEVLLRSPEQTTTKKKKKKKKKKNVVAAWAVVVPQRSTCRAALGRVRRPLATDDVRGHQHQPLARRAAGRVGGLGGDRRVASSWVARSALPMNASSTSSSSRISRSVSGSASRTPRRTATASAPRPSSPKRLARRRAASTRRETSGARCATRASSPRAVLLARVQHSTARARTRRRRRAAAQAARPVRARAAAPRSSGRPARRAASAARRSVATTSASPRGGALTEVLGDALIVYAVVGEQRGRARVQLGRRPLRRSPRAPPPRPAGG